jgi:ribosomal protein S18 acetylase RimI-like enzyme
MTRTISPLSQEHVPQVVRLMTDAFEHDPLFRLTFGDDPAERKHRTERMFDIGAKARLEGCGFMLGVLEDEDVVAAAYLRAPESLPWPQHLSDEFTEAVGPEGSRFFELYMELQKKFHVEEPHLYLIAIGVRPDCQGKGIGRSLLRHIRSLAEEDESMAGVCLETDSPRNIELYKSEGYEVMGEADLEGLPITFMFQRVR